MQENPYGQNPAGPAPIPAPEALHQTVAVANRGDWQTAPVVIRSWAYTLAFLGMLGGGLVVIASFFNDDPVGEKAGTFILGILLLALSFWQRKGLRNGTSAAWTVQIILSGLGLLGFPLGTMIHGYILSKWFQPDVKAWFGQQ